MDTDNRGTSAVWPRTKFFGAMARDISADILPGLMADAVGRYRDRVREQQIKACFQQHLTARNT
jgi:hypothetical protein